MLGIRKRGSAYDSDGPSGKPEASPDLKRRKTESGTVDHASDSASSTETTESPGPVSSDPPTPENEILVKPVDKKASVGEEEKVDKGKSTDKDGAAPLDLITAELERLKKEVASKNELIAKQEATIAAVKEALQCNICMEMSVSPYILSCGHVACYVCLYTWWTTQQAGDNNPLPSLPLREPWQPDGVSDDESEDEIDDPPPPFAVPLRSVVPADGGDGPSNDPPPAEDGSPNQANGTATDTDQEEEDDDEVVLDVTGRIKICATCRTVIHTPPIRVYMMSMLFSIFGLSEKRPKNPWRGVFPSEKELEKHAHFPDDNPPARVQEEILLDYPPLILPDRRLDLPPNNPPPILPVTSAVADREDNVLRCGLCLHELWHGQCTNSECAAMYEGDSDDSGSDANPAFERRRLNQVEVDDDNPDWVARPGDDGYESSFIDDTDEHQDGVPIPSSDDQDDGVLLTHRTSGSHHENVIDPVSDNEDVPGPSNRRRRRQATRVLSEPEPDSDTSEYDPPRNTRRSGRRPQDWIVHSDSVSEDDVEGVVGPPSANDAESRVDALAHRSEDSNDEYDGGFVPYAWDQDDSSDEAGSSGEGEITTARPHLSISIRDEDEEEYVY